MVLHKSCTYIPSPHGQNLPEQTAEEWMERRRSAPCRSRKVCRLSCLALHAGGVSRHVVFPASTARPIARLVSRPRRLAPFATASAREVVEAAFLVWAAPISGLHGPHHRPRRRARAHAHHAAHLAAAHLAAAHLAGERHATLAGQERLLHHLHHECRVEHHVVRALAATLTEVEGLGRLALEALHALGEAMVPATPADPVPNLVALPNHAALVALRPVREVVGRATRAHPISLLDLGRLTWKLLLTLGQAIRRRHAGNRRIQGLHGPVATNAGSHASAIDSRGLALVASLAACEVVVAARCAHPITRLHGSHVAAGDDGDGAGGV
mmetsp:Transcript_79426/g.227930  ORF Transcript_79426/g.227930 Transcript_79426/m.227930 type:complete len:326 (-) Transcript_79426:6-983(-)